MLRKTAFLLLLIGGLTASASAQNAAVVKPEVTAGLLMGYNSGFGVQTNLMIANFAQGFPLGARVGIGYTRMQPGSAAGARKIFINDATNGTPEEKGTAWDFRLDLAYPVKLFNLNKAYVVGGPRYSRFNGNFVFVGGNEDFNIKSNQWGLGLGLETYFPMSHRMQLVFSGGVDHFFSASLSGHDTVYSPDGDNANTRLDYTFDDADEAIDQPKNEFRVMFGVTYSL